MKDVYKTFMIILALTLGVCMANLYVERLQAEALTDKIWKLECESAFYLKTATSNAQELGKMEAANRALNQIIEDMIEAAEDKTRLIENQKMRILKLQEGDRP